MAGLGRRTFAPGEVLTASNVMNYLQDQVVQTYAGTAARGSAIGTAVSEGMVSYLADSDEVQVYTDSWNSLAYSADVPSADRIGLVPMVPSSVDISGGTATANSVGQVTFSGVSSVSLNGVFTSVYDNYKIVITAGAASTGTDLRIRLRNGGTDRTTTNHFSGATLIREGGSGVLVGNASATNFDILRLFNVANTNSSSVTILQPQNGSSGTSCLWHSWSNDGSGGYAFIGSGLYNLTNTNDGLTLYSSGTITGKVSVYGYND